MAYGDARSASERLIAAFFTGLLTAAVGAGLLSNWSVAQRFRDDTLKAFNIEPLPPPPAEPAPAIVPEPKVAAPEPEGEAAPPGIKQQPTPVVAPKPKTVVPPRPVPVKAAEKAGTGDAPKAGAAETPGPGSGASGDGTGIGSGGSGSGTGGGGGVASNAQKLGGTINNSDIPPSTITAEGRNYVVRVRYRVQPNGRATSCTVTKSSGIPTLDSLTCRLVEQRFVYMPAKDSSGKPIASVTDHAQTYWLGPR